MAARQTNNGLGSVTSDGARNRDRQQYQPAESSTRLKRAGTEHELADELPGAWTDLDDLESFGAPATVQRGAGPRPLPRNMPPLPSGASASPSGVPTNVVAVLRRLPPPLPRAIPEPAQRAQAKRGSAASTWLLLSIVAASTGMLHAADLPWKNWGATAIEQARAAAGSARTWLAR